MTMNTGIIQKRIETIGEITRFTATYFRKVVQPGFVPSEFLRQCFFIGYKSLALVLITALITGIVITIQSRPLQTELSGAGWIPKMLLVSLVREIVPVITALMCAGKAGSAIAAELAAMTVSGKITALEQAGKDPYRCLVVPRTTAAWLMMPFLCVLATGVALYGAFLGTNIHGVVNWTYYWSQVFETINYQDIFPSLIKSSFFGFGIAIISSYK
jgi:phospholipid/cholesterol/gamma-HCH transport system permease protein